MEVVQLDSMPADIKAEKKRLEEMLLDILVRRLKGKEILRFSPQLGNELIDADRRGLMSHEISLTSATIHAIKRLTSSIKQSWHVTYHELQAVIDDLKLFLRVLGVGSSQLADVERFLSPLLAKCQKFQEVNLRPILLLSDSMFLRLKPTVSLYPIARPGQRAEDLLWELEMFKPQLDVGHIVLNHGLNHTRHYGTPEEDMVRVFDWLRTHYPSARLYHLEAPLSPKLRALPQQASRMKDFSVMMRRIGFRGIPHPLLDPIAFDVDGFHYTPEAMKGVASYLIDSIRGGM